jgi:hypothetical protein
VTVTCAIWLLSSANMDPYQDSSIRRDVFDETAWRWSHMRTETCSNYQIKPMWAVRLVYFYFYCCVEGQIPPIIILLWASAVEMSVTMSDVCFDERCDCSSSCSWWWVETCRAAKRRRPLWQAFNSVLRSHGADRFPEEHLPPRNIPRFLFRLTTLLPCDPSRRTR